jgi:hypothetical protein
MSGSGVDGKDFLADHETLCGVAGDVAGNVAILSWERTLLLLLQHNGVPSLIQLRFLVIEKRGREASRTSKDSLHALQIAKHKLLTLHKPDILHYLPKLVEREEPCIDLAVEPLILAPAQNFG